MNCTVQDLTSLQWFFDNTQIASYTFSATQMLPFVEPNMYEQDGVDVRITEAHSLSPDSDEFNATSVLTTTTLALGKLQVESVRCGTRSVESQPVELPRLNVQGK